MLRRLQIVLHMKLTSEEVDSNVNIQNGDRLVESTSIFLLELNFGRDLRNVKFLRREVNQGELKLKQNPKILYVQINVRETLL